MFSLASRRPRGCELSGYRDPQFLVLCAAFSVPLNFPASGSAPCSPSWGPPLSQALQCPQPGLRHLLHLFDVQFFV